MVLSTQSLELSPLPGREADGKGWYAEAMRRLVLTVEELSYARDLPSLMKIVREAARNLTGADGATFVLMDDGHCFYAEENAIAPLWKGRRFKAETCISGWVMKHAQPVMIEDIYADPRIPVDAYRPTFVKSLAMVPIRKEHPIGAIGNYWGVKRQATDEEIEILQALANIVSVTMENIGLYDELQIKIKALETSNTELSRFAWIASHDLKSPLRAIDNLSTWLEEDLGTVAQGKTKEYLSNMRQRVKRMENLLDDILLYSQIDRKLEPANLEFVNGADLLKDAIALIDVPKSFSIVSNDVFKSLKLPRMPLQQILFSLISNAIEHHDKSAGNIEIKAVELPDHYVFSVKDDGPGIDKQFHTQIFEMFETLQPHHNKLNSGMGLSIVKKILSTYGGEISVTSEPGNGSIFTFTWPK